jgi:hypothetical protein
VSGPILGDQLNNRWSGVPLLARKLGPHTTVYSTDRLSRRCTPVNTNFDINRTRIEFTVTYSRSSFIGASADPSCWLLPLKMGSDTSAQSLHLSWNTKFVRVLPSWWSWGVAESWMMVWRGIVNYIATSSEIAVIFECLALVMNFLYHWHCDSRIMIHAVVVKRRNGVSIQFSAHHIVISSYSQGFGQWPYWRRSFVARMSRAMAILRYKPLTLDLMETLDHFLQDP